MNDTERFEQWATRGHWTDWARYRDRSEALSVIVFRACNKLEAGEHLTAAKLIDQALPGASPVMKQYVTSGLQYLRRNKIVDGYWRHGPKNAHTFGKPSVQWVNPVTIHGTEGLEGVL